MAIQTSPEESHFILEGYLKNAVNTFYLSIPPEWWSHHRFDSIALSSEMLSNNALQQQSLLVPSPILILSLQYKIVNLSSPAQPPYFTHACSVSSLQKYLLLLPTQQPYFTHVCRSSRRCVTSRLSLHLTTRKSKACPSSDHENIKHFSFLTQGLLLPDSR